MIRIVMALGTVVAMLLLDVPAAQPAATTPSPAAKPEALSLQLGHGDFITYCAACHGVGAKGDGTVAEYLTINAADLTQLKKKNNGLFPREHITGVIDGRTEVKTHGPRDMPVWGDWFKFEAEASKAGKGASEAVIAARIGALVNYIESIQEN